MEAFQEDMDNQIKWLTLKREGDFPLFLFPIVYMFLLVGISGGEKDLLV